MFKSLVVLMSLVSSLSFAADGNAGKALYQGRCAACHGATGVNPSPLFPNLAGQKEAYVLQQLVDFKSGKRTGTMMPAMVADLTPEQFADLAAYIAALSPCQTEFQ